MLALFSFTFELAQAEYACSDLKWNKEKKKFVPLSCLMLPEANGFLVHTICLQAPAFRELPFDAGVWGLVVWFMGSEQNLMYYACCPCSHEVLGFHKLTTINEVGEAVNPCLHLELPNLLVRVNRESILGSVFDKLVI